MQTCMMKKNYALDCIILVHFMLQQLKQIKKDVISSNGKLKQSR